jgi:hypothetical protein
MDLTSQRLGMYLAGRQVPREHCITLADAGITGSDLARPNAKQDLIDFCKIPEHWAGKIVDDFHALRSQSSLSSSPASASSSLPLPSSVAPADAHPSSSSSGQITVLRDQRGLGESRFEVASVPRQSLQQLTRLQLESDIAAVAIPLFGSQLTPEEFCFDELPTPVENPRSFCKTNPSDVNWLKLILRVVARPATQTETYLHKVGNGIQEVEYSAEAMLNGEIAHAPAFVEALVVFIGWYGLDWENALEDRRLLSKINEVVRLFFQTDVHKLKIGGYRRSENKTDPSLVATTRTGTQGRLFGVHIVTDLLKGPDHRYYLTGEFNLTGALRVIRSALRGDTSALKNPPDVLFDYVEFLGDRGVRHDATNEDIQQASRLSPLELCQNFRGMFLSNEKLVRDEARKLGTVKDRSTRPASLLSRVAALYTHMAQTQKDSAWAKSEPLDPLNFGSFMEELLAPNCDHLAVATSSTDDESRFFDLLGAGEPGDVVHNVIPLDDGPLHSLGELEEFLSVVQSSSTNFSAISRPVNSSSASSSAISGTSSPSPSVCRKRPVSNPTPDSRDVKRSRFASTTPGSGLDAFNSVVRSVNAATSVTGRARIKAEQLGKRPTIPRAPTSVQQSIWKFTGQYLDADNRVLSTGRPEIHPIWQQVVPKLSKLEIARRKRFAERRQAPEQHVQIYYVRSDSNHCGFAACLAAINGENYEHLADGGIAALKTALIGVSAKMFSADVKIPQHVAAQVRAGPSTTKMEELFRDKHADKAKATFTGDYRDRACDVADLVTLCAMKLCRLVLWKVRKTAENTPYQLEKEPATFFEAQREWRHELVLVQWDQGSNHQHFDIVGGSPDRTAEGVLAEDARQKQAWIVAAGSAAETQE